MEKRRISFKALYYETGTTILINVDKNGKTTCYEWKKINSQSQYYITVQEREEKGDDLGDSAEIY